MNRFEENYQEIADRYFARKIYEECAREDAARNARLPRRETIHLRAVPDALEIGEEGTGETCDE